MLLVVLLRQSENHFPQEDRIRSWKAPSRKNEVGFFCFSIFPNKVFLTPQGDHMSSYAKLFQHSQKLQLPTANRNTEASCRVSVESHKKQLPVRDL